MIRIPVILEYDPEADAGYLTFTHGPVHRTIALERSHLQGDINVDVTEEGTLVGIELVGLGHMATEMMLAAQPVGAGLGLGRVQTENRDGIHTIVGANLYEVSLMPYVDPEHGVHPIAWVKPAADSDGPR